MTFITTHAQETVFEATALQVSLEFPVNMVGQGLTLMGKLVHQCGVEYFDELVEQCLLRLMALVAGFAKATPDNAGWALPMNRGQALPALCQHGGSVSNIQRAKRARLGQQHEECHVRSAR